MINLFIEDYNKNLFYQLVSLPNITIIGVHVKFLEEKKEIVEKYPNIPVYLTNEIINWSSSFVSQREISRNYKSQIKVEHFFNRYRDDTASEKQQYYYSCLAFWEAIFTQNKIDCVLIGQIDHGSPADTVLMDIAVEKGIPTYIFEVMLYNYDTYEYYYSIKCCNSNNYINVQNLGLSFASESSIAEYISSINHHKRKNISNDYSIFKDLDHNILPSHHLLRSLIIIFINIIIFLPRNISRIAKRKYNSKIIAERLIKGLKLPYLYINYWFLFLCNKKHKMELQGDVVDQSYKNYINGLVFTKKIYKYYQKLAKRDIPHGENYIIYALHLEPEASIMARTIYNSQLYNLSMLAHLLPPGWKLYVKEHPVQFDRINDGMFYTGYVNNFRRKEFYDKIVALPNTYLLDCTIPSSELLSGKRDFPKPMAISTINGTITLESIVHEIPAIVFGKDTISYESPLIFGIESADDLVTSLNIIKNKQYNNDNNNMILKESLNNHLFIVTRDFHFSISQEILKKLVNIRPLS